MSTKAKNSAKNVSNELENESTVEVTPRLRMPSSTENKPDFNSREWLESNEPTDYFVDGNTSSKYDDEREPKIQEALPILANMELNGAKINPLILLLGKWWEVKPARNSIKKMIDIEAEEKGFEATDYLQNVLSAQIESFSKIQTAIDRLRYAKTYFKPRPGAVLKKVPTTIINIDGKPYEISSKLLNELKLEFSNDKALLKAKVLENATPHVINVVEEL